MAAAYGTTTKNVLVEDEPRKYEFKTILGFSRNNKYEAILLVFSFIYMIVFNVLSNAICGVGEKPICKNNSQQSDQNPTYLTPDGLTFSIWGIIYLFELFFTVYQLCHSLAEAGLSWRFSTMCKAVRYVCIYSERHVAYLVFIFIVVAKSSRHFCLLVLHREGIRTLGSGLVFPS